MKIFYNGIGKWMSGTQSVPDLRLGENAPNKTEGAEGMRWFELVANDKKTVEGIRFRAEKAGVVVEEKAEGFLLHDPAGNGVVVKEGG